MTHLFHRLEHVRFKERNEILFLTSWMIFNVDANLKKQNELHIFFIMRCMIVIRTYSRQVIKTLHQKRNESYYYQGKWIIKEIRIPIKSQNVDHPKLKILLLVTDRTILEIVIAMKSFYLPVYVHCADIFTVGIDLTIFFSSRFL